MHAQTAQPSPQSPSQSMATIAQSLQRQLACAQSLQDTLEEEFTALSGDDVDRLQRITTDKATSAQHLQQATAGLLQMLRISDLRQVPARLGQLGANANQLGHWSRLTELAQQLSDANQRNARVLATRRAAVQTALAALGQHAPPTYTPRQLGTYDSTRRSFGQA